MTQVSNANLTFEEKILCKTYSLFYKEIPNFKKEDHIIKAQIMASLLNKYGIVLSEYYNFSVVGQKGRYPSSIYLRKDIYDLSKKEFNPSDYDISFYENVLNIIQIVSDEINKYIKNSKDEVESLIRIGRISYFMEYDTLYERRYKEMIEAFQYDKEDIDECVSLVKRLIKNS